MDIFEKFLAKALPGVVASRLKAKKEIERLLNEEQPIVEKKRSYNGAARSRNTEDFIGTSNSANLEIQKDLVLLRNRSRELARNNPYVKNWLRIMSNSIVGTGIRATVALQGRSGKPDKINELWKAYANNVKCDYDQRYNFYGLQHLIIKTVQQSGECLIMRRRATSKYAIPLRLQVLEADFIDTSKFSLENEYGGITWYGIEFNKHGERVGYWLWNRHPGEFATQSHRIAASEIIHVYHAERPGQVRGVPENHSVILTIKDLNDYEYNERLRLKIANCLVGAITQDTADGDDDLASAFETMEPGTFHRLRKGEEVTFNTVPTSNGYADYVNKNLHAIAAGSGTTYEAMTGDLSNVNFSSGRMGWLEFQRNVTHWQNDIMIPFCDAVFEWFVEAAQVAGYIPMGAKVSATWTPPRREMIDPYKEGKALAEAVRNKFMTWSEAVQERGDSPEDVFKRLQEEYTMFKNAGLKPESFSEFDADRKDFKDGRPDTSAMRS